MLVFKAKNIRELKSKVKKLTDVFAPTELSIQACGYVGDTYLDREPIDLSDMTVKFTVFLPRTICLTNKNVQGLSFFVKQV